MQHCSLIDDLRKPKIFNMPIFDWIITLIPTYFLTCYLHRYFKQYNFYWFLFFVTILVIIVGIIVHKLLDINTMLGYYLGVNGYPKRIKCI